MTVDELLRELHRHAAALDQPIRIMEVCGTHTMSAFRHGIRSLLPRNLSLISGPGCPVCVTPVTFVDQAIRLAHRADTTVTLFGDMMRVPGAGGNLEEARAGGASVQVVYSALDALDLARRCPSTQVVFLGIGFETTAPGTAWAIRTANKEVPNFSVLCAHKTMPQAMAALLRQGDVQIDGFLCPGHVSVITGPGIYEFIALEYRRPCVVTGFEAADMLQGILSVLRQLSSGQPCVEVQYTRGVRPGGNPKARALLNEVFEPSDVEWRGLGVVPGSGLAIRPAFIGQDAQVRFELPQPSVPEPSGCRCGDVLRGSIQPPSCPMFRTRCTPENPVGACMVSAEGTCAAFYKYE
jgi:hydrogenase expression/formation protein HypD